jgi:hypothetical protein
LPRPLSINAVLTCCQFDIISVAAAAIAAAMAPTGPRSVVKAAVTPESAEISPGKTLLTKNPNMNNTGPRAAATPAPTMIISCILLDRLEKAEMPR